MWTRFAGGAGCLKVRRLCLPSDQVTGGGAASESSRSLRTTRSSDGGLARRVARRRAVRVVDGHGRQGFREWPRRVDDAWPDGALLVFVGAAGWSRDCPGWLRRAVDARPDVALLVFMGAAFAGVVAQAVIDRLCPVDGVQRVNGGGRVTRAIRGHRTTPDISCRKAERRLTASCHGAQRTLIDA